MIGNLSTDPRIELAWGLCHALAVKSLLKSELVFLRIIGLEPIYNKSGECFDSFRVVLIPEKFGSLSSDSIRWSLKFGSLFLPDFL